MSESIIHSAFVIDRIYLAGPERAFAAFADPAKKRRWFVEGDGHDVEEFALDFRIGGQERARYRFHAGTPLAGNVLTSESHYLVIVPNQRIVFAYTMSVGEQCISASLATIEFVSGEAGTTVHFTHQGAYFAGADGPQIREMGWRHLLERLAQELAR